MDAPLAIAPRVIPLRNTSALNEYYKSGFRSLSEVTQCWVLVKIPPSVRPTSDTIADKPDTIADLIRIFRGTNSLYFGRLIKHIPWLQNSPQEQRVLEQMLHIREKEELYERGQLDLNSSVQLGDRYSCLFQFRREVTLPPAKMTLLAMISLKSTRELSSVATLSNDARLIRSLQEDVLGRLRESHLQDFDFNHEQYRNFVECASINLTDEALLALALVYWYFDPQHGDSYTFDAFLEFLENPYYCADTLRTIKDRFRQETKKDLNLDFFL